MARMQYTTRHKGAPKAENFAQDAQLAAIATLIDRL